MRFLFQLIHKKDVFLNISFTFKYAKQRWINPTANETNAHINL